MFLACGVGAFIAAIFHVMTHAFFKALLFLGSGSVIHGMHHEQDMRRMGGLKKYMPITFATMLTGWLAICGIPIFAGFFSKDEILWKTWSAGEFSLPRPIWSKVLWVVGALTALLTAVYMTRMMVMTFWGKERFRETARRSACTKATDSSRTPCTVHEPHESPWIMTVPLIVLAVLSTVGGLIGVPYALEFDYSAIIPSTTSSRRLSRWSPSSGKRAHGESTDVADEMQWLSPKPQPVDGAPAIHAAGWSGSRKLPNTSIRRKRFAQERLLALVSVLIALTGIGIGWFTFPEAPAAANAAPAREQVLRR